MYCTQCGAVLSEDDRFCSKCGHATRSEYTATASAVPVRLSRPHYLKKLGGVCAGFARYFGVDVTLMRILWVAFTVITGGLGVLVYLAAWIIMPRDDQALEQAGVQQTSGQVRAV